MACKLEALSAEIVQLIGGNLEPTDVCSLRLVCRQLEMKSSARFLERFGTLCTNLTPKSLQRLHDISESKQLAQQVEYLDIRCLSDCLGRGYDWPRHSSGQLVAPYVATDLLRDLLMKKFVKCRSFCIDGCYKDEQHDGLLELSDVVEIVLSIVAYTGLGIKSFVLDPQMKSTSRLDTERLQIPPHCTPQFKAAWEHLEELVLECSLIQAQEAWLLALLSHASRLRNLSLGFSTKASDSDFGGSFIERLTTVYPFRGLQEIEMYHATVPAETLLNFLLRSRDTLRILVLRLATIKAGGSWNKFLESMRAEFPRLESLALHMPRQQTQRGHNGFKVMFPKLAENPRFPGSEEREFNGSNLIFDSRLVKPLARPVNLTCACQAGKTKVVSARYQGPDIDAFLSIIAATVETSTEA